MKRKQFYEIIFLMVLVLFVVFSASLTIQAQGKSGELPGAKPTPTPAPKGGTTTRPSPRVTNAPAAPAAPVTSTLTYNQEFKGKLDPQSSDKSPSGTYFEEYVLNAKSDDLISIQLQSSSPGLGVQILDKANAEVAVNKDATTGEFKIATPSGGLPGDGEYRLRVTGAANSRNTAPFTLKVTRLGLVQNVYNARLEKTYLAYFGPRENDPAVIDETLSDLVELVKDDGNKPGAYEMLGIVYLNSRRDPAKAEWAMGQAIKNNGAAVIKITFDSQWRRLAKLKSGKVDWEDPRSGWLRIYSGKMSLTDPASRVLASVDGAQIKELTKVVTNNNHLVTINVEGVRRPFVFLPGNRESLDADLVIKFIQTYVVGKKN